MIALGKSIVLEGFKDINGGQMVILKKLLGNYVKDISSKHDFQKLSLNLSKVDIGENTIYHIIGELITDRQHCAEAKEKNMFFAIDKCLKVFDKEL